MEVQKTELKSGSGPGNFSVSGNATTPENIFGLFGDVLNSSIDDYLEKKGINPESVPPEVKGVMEYLTSDLGSVSGGVQIYGYDNATKALEILGMNLKPKNEYLG